MIWMLRCFETTDEFIPHFPDSNPHPASVPGEQNPNSGSENKHSTEFALLEQDEFILRNIEATKTEGSHNRSFGFLFTNYAGALHFEQNSSWGRINS